MTTRTRILLLALALLSLLTCACADVAEWATGDNGANRAHGRQTGAETTLDLDLAVTPTVEVPE